MATRVHGLAPEQRSTLEDRGLVRLPRLIPRALALAMADLLWAELARRHGIRRQEPRTWRTERPADFKALQASGAFDAMASPGVRSLLDEVLGRDRWTRPRYWGQPLVCFPRAYGRWDVPHTSWHIDLPVDARQRGATVARLFAVLAPLASRGGGTLVAAGSHRIVQRLVDEWGYEHSSGEVRKRLKTRYRWFADLMSSRRERDRVTRFMQHATEVDGTSLRVEEMTGEPGDVFLMHPAALHAAAPNVLDTPRLVLAQLVLAKT